MRDTVVVCGLVGLLGALAGWLMPAPVSPGDLVVWDNIDCQRVDDASLPQMTLDTTKTICLSTAAPVAGRRFQR